MSRLSSNNASRTATMELNESQWNTIIMALESVAHQTELATFGDLASDIAELVKVQY